MTFDRKWLICLDKQQRANERTDEWTAFINYCYYFILNVNAIETQSVKLTNNNAQLKWPPFKSANTQCTVSLAHKSFRKCSKYIEWSNEWRLNELIIFFTIKPPSKSFEVKMAVFFQFRFRYRSHLRTLQVKWNRQKREKKRKWCD